MWKRISLAKVTFRIASPWPVQDTAPLLLSAYPPDPLSHTQESTKILSLNQQHVMIKQMSLKNNGLNTMHQVIYRTVAVTCTNNHFKTQSQAAHQYKENLQLFPPFCSWFLLSKLHRQHSQMHPEPLLQLCHGYCKIKFEQEAVLLFFFFRFNYAVACHLKQAHLVKENELLISLTQIISFEVL